MEQNNNVELTSSPTKKQTKDIKTFADYQGNYITT